MKFRFTLRDWLWLVLVLAILMTWFIKDRRTAAQLMRLEQQRRQLNIDFQKQKVQANLYLRYWMQAMRASVATTGDTHAQGTDGPADNQ